MNVASQLIYVYLGGSMKASSSVQNKISDQIEGLNKAGLSCVGWFFSTEVTEDTHYGNHIIFKPLKPNKSNGGFWSKHRNKQAQIAQVHSALKSQSGNTPLFLRHISSGSAYFKMLTELGPRIFLYIPSNTIRENHHEFLSGFTGSIAGKLFKALYYITATWWPEWRFHKFYTAKVKACVAFTPEFCDMIRKKSLFPVRMIYNRDGASPRRVPVREPVHESGIVKLLFMKGSNSVQRWAGLDRLMKSIKTSGKGRFELYITGRVFDGHTYDEDFIRQTGRLGEQELNELINKADLGVSNLANYMIGFSETTNLKSREYFVRGLPFIQANSMPDIENTPLRDYYLRLPNDSSLIDMDRVYQFAMDMRSRRNHPEEMRRLAETMLDWDITTAELAAAIRNSNS